MGKNHIKKIAQTIKINGIVQGVGFRPFIFKIANKYYLKGEVTNTSSGVLIYIQGNKDNINLFLKEIKNNPPPISHITSINLYDVPFRNFDRFSIASSIDNQQESTLISPDISLCKDCLYELFNPNDRRFLYPFINCTNCGPRYTIIKNLPYDRQNTSMTHFKMCQKCQNEYDNSSDRRFHTQPNACSQCGPILELFDSCKKKCQTNDPIKKASELLKKGHIIAVKGIGGFHLAVDAKNNFAVAKLRAKKQRKEKPLAIMSYDIKNICKYAYINLNEKKLLESEQKPIVILKKIHNLSENKNFLKHWTNKISPNNNDIGVMLPYTPIHYLLLKQGPDPIVMTSANKSSHPIIIGNEDAFTKLSDIADYFLIHNREIYFRTDDSIIKYVAGKKRLIRRSRGYAPVPLFLENNMPQVLGCGSELKNTICLLKNNYAFLSSHIGDLENMDSYDVFKSTIEHMTKILKIDSEIIAYDMHPDYLSTQYALKVKNGLKIPVQHHHAHIVSCMAENNIQDKVIGIALDGTGYGTDKNIWGGEILISDFCEFTRAAHLSYIPMPGGSTAIKEPWRMGISSLLATFGNEFWGLNLPILKPSFPEYPKIKTIVEMIEKQINSPLTSSIGRLFDSVAAITGIKSFISFEGQAAIDLEMIAKDDKCDSYSYEWADDKIKKILIKPIIQGIVKDMEKGISISKISAKFHQTLIYLFSDLCEKIRFETGINQVVLSGGSFQNSILLNGLITQLKNKKFKTFTHTIVPANDGGISLGQAIIAGSIANLKI